MTIILLRDDDANATTDPERLAQVYAPLLDAGMPVSFSVIPEVACDTLAPDGARERFLGDDVPVSSACVPLTHDAPLSGWLRRHQSEVDVLAHGLTHQRVRENTEFGALTSAEAHNRITRGRDTLVRALGRAPSGFVAPWDALGRASLVAACAAYPLVSLCWVGRRTLPLRAWPAHVAERVRKREALRVGGAWVVRHRGGRIAAETRAEDVEPALAELDRGAAAVTIVLHHWMYWHAGSAHPAIVALARALRGRRVVRALEAPAALDAEA